jgi:hypothetical protein
LRRCTRRYSSQRDEFYHAKQIQNDRIMAGIDFHAPLFHA